jgi:hypothetical protein
MTLHAPMRCSALAEQLDEPMIGTVDQRTRWLLLEDRSAWGADAVRDVFGDAAAHAKALGMRLLLVRRREGDPAADAVRRAMLVDTETGEMTVRSVSGPEDLSVDEAANGPVSAFGDPLAEPIFLVCTNGKRDACCALRGRALMAALAVEHADGLWECTHLGGHRFAGNLVCLPDGIVYGRVDPDDGPRLAALYRTGRIDPALMRGRSRWPAPAQVAEHALRSRLGLDRVDAVQLLDASVSGDTAAVTLAAAGTTHAFALRAERATPRPISCRADELEEPLHWVVAG